MQNILLCIICQFTLFPPHTHVPIPKSDFKIHEGRAYPSFNFPIGPNIVARNIWDDPYYLRNG